MKLSLICFALLTLASATLASETERDVVICREETRAQVVSCIRETKASIQDVCEESGFDVASIRVGAIDCGLFGLRGYCTAQIDYTCSH